MGVRDLGKWWSQDGSTLQLTGHSTTTGSNKIGDFTVYQYDWKASGGASSLQIQTFVNIYDRVPVVEFGLAFVGRATNTNISNYVNRTLSSFPSFVVEEGEVERGYLTWSGNSEYEHGMIQPIQHGGIGREREKEREKGRRRRRRMRLTIL